MPRSTSSYLFPDVNIWLALTYDRHVQHATVNQWYLHLADDARVCFCRFTQLGFLRLLTTDAVMGADQVRTQRQAWDVYDRCLSDDRVSLLDEPPGMESRFRALSQEKRPAVKDWADSYLAAFAIVAGLRLVTFDQALNKKSPDSILLV
jgi:uncharacterized protein